MYMLTLYTNVHVNIKYKCTCLHYIQMYMLTLYTNVHVYIIYKCTC